MRRYTPRRTDSTHKLIGRALRAVTATIDVHELGKVGCDFIAMHTVTGAPVFIEVKSDKKISHRNTKALTANERLMSILYPGHWRRVETEDEARAAVGVT